MIAWETVEDSIRDVAVEHTEIEWVWANQAAPQPEWPYGTLNVIAGPDPIGTLDEDRRVNETGGDDVVLTTVGMREMTVSHQISVDTIDPNCHARALMTRLQAALGRESVLTKLYNAANIALIERLPIVSLDLVVGGKWVTRVSMDARYRVTSKVEEDIQSIRQIKITGTVTGNTTDPADETIPDPPPF